MTAQNVIVNNTWLEALETKPAEVIVLPDDPIALGCASYRLAQAGLGQYHELHGLKVEPEDRQQAQNIRNYYRAKITWELLKKTQNQLPVTAFRKKLMGIIEGTHTITENDLGILYRVPYFYVEDTEQDAIFQGLPEYEILQTRAESIEAEFTFHKRVTVMRRSHESFQYWLKAKDSIVPCMTVIEKRNMLRPLFESIIAQGPVKLRANWYPKNLWSREQDRMYYQLSRVELA